MAASRHGPIPVVVRGVPSPLPILETPTIDRDPLPPGVVIDFDGSTCAAWGEGSTYSSVGTGVNGERLLSGVDLACPALTAQDTSASCPCF